jgi:hypothetical protein
LSDLDNPRYWQQLYSPPADSNTHSGAASSALEFEEGDLDAFLDPVAVRAAEVAMDHGAIAALVETMVKERIAEMLASGQLSAGGPGGGGQLGAQAIPDSPGVGGVGLHTPPGPTPLSDFGFSGAEAPPSRPRPVSSPGLRPAPPRPSTSPGVRAVPGRPRTSPGLRAVPGTPPPPSSGPASYGGPPTTSEPSLRTIERPSLRDTLPPPPPPPARAAVPPAVPRPASSPSRPAPPPRPAAFSPAAAPRPEAGPRPIRPAPSSGGASPTASRPSPAVGAAMWERIPSLPGGPAALLGVGDLSQEAISVLVMVNGSTSLRGLRTLVPQLDDAAFLTIIRTAVKQGVLELG